MPELAFSSFDGHKQRNFKQGGFARSIRTDEGDAFLLLGEVEVGIDQMIPIDLTNLAEWLPLSASGRLGKVKARWPDSSGGSCVPCARGS